MCCWEPEEYTWLNFSLIYLSFFFSFFSHRLNVSYFPVSFDVIEILEIKCVLWLEINYIKEHGLNQNIIK